MSFSSRTPLQCGALRWWLIYHTEALEMKVFGDSPSQPPLVRVAALEAFKSPLSGYQGPQGLREKTQGAMVSGSPSGEIDFGQSSPAAKTGEFTTIPKKLLQAFFLVRLKLNSRRSELLFSHTTWCPRLQPPTCKARRWASHPAAFGNSVRPSRIELHQHTL